MAANAGASHLQSDLILDVQAFQPGATTDATRAWNAAIIKGCKADEKWWQIGAQEYRDRRAAGRTPFPPAVQLDDAATVFNIKSIRTGSEIPCRGFFGRKGEASTGIFYHIHGGGYVLGSAKSQDTLLHEIQSRTSLSVISVDYRLAPEHPWPAALDDCIDVADWLVEHGEAEHGASLRFIGGESAGATLSALVMQNLRDRKVQHSIAGLVLNYGAFDLSYLASVRMLDADQPLVLSFEDAEMFSKAYGPTLDRDERKHPRLSPMYASLTDLGSAIFIVGTADGLLDDSLLMAAKWQIAGNEAVLKLLPGAAHGFMTFDGNKVEVTRQGWDIMLQYLNTRLCSVEGRIVQKGAAQ